MTVSVSNTNLIDNFNTWRLNTNYLATIVSNNVVTVSRAGSAERGGVAKGNGHISGTFTANELRTTVLRSGNTSSDGGWLYLTSNTVVNATSLAITANTTFQGNITFATAGTDRLTLGDISRIRVTGGSRGQFLTIIGSSDTPNFKSITLRDLTDLSSNSSNIILSGANSVFSDNGDSPSLVLAGGIGTSDSAEIFLAADALGESDVFVKLVDSAGRSKFTIADSGNNVVSTVDSDGNLDFAGTITSGGQFNTAGHIVPTGDDAFDLGDAGSEFRNLYIDGVANIDELNIATGANQGVSSSLIPKTDAAGNLGSSNRKWGTVWADTTNGGAGVFNTVGVSGALSANGTTTTKGNLVVEADFIMTGNVASDIIPNTTNGTGHYNLGSTSQRFHEVYANTVIANNVVVDNNVDILGDLTVQGNTTFASGAVSAPDGTFTSLTVTGTTLLNGNIDLGSDATDKVNIRGDIDSNLIPNGLRNIGSSIYKWNSAWFRGAVNTKTLQVDNDANIDGEFTTGNTVIGGSLDVTDSIDVTNAITNDGTVMFGGNASLHANNTINDFSITPAMLANTMSTGGNFGSTTQIPVFSVNNRGQVTGIKEVNVAGVSSVAYTQSNNNIRINTADGSTFDTTVLPATTTSSTGRGVASFDSGDFSLSSGHVSLADSASGAVIGINGTSNEVNVSRTNGTVTVGLPDDVSITGQLSVGENVVITGNLVVQGTTTTVNSETVNIADNIIVLNSNETGAPSQNGGFTVERGTSINYSFLWDETSDRWTVGNRNLVANTFIGNVNGAVIGNVTGTLTGNADTATALQTARSIGINLTGDITGSGAASFDGTGNITINATNMAVQNNSVDLGTHTTGNYVAGLTPGTCIDIINALGEGVTATIDLDLSELTSFTGTLVSTDEFVILDNGAQRRMKVEDIPLGLFSNDLGFVSDSGVTSVTVSAGNGLDGGGTVTTTGTISLSVESDLRGDVWQIGRDTNDYYNIGTTTHDWYLDGTHRMRLETDGDLHVDGDVVAYSTTVSDERKKKDITIVENAVEKVKQLRGVEFTYTRDDKRSAGLIAQDVQKVLPQAVKETTMMGDSDDMKSLVLEYAQINALLVEAIKELSAEIDELKKNK